MPVAHTITICGFDTGKPVSFVDKVENILYSGHSVVVPISMPLCLRSEFFMFLKLGDEFTAFFSIVYVELFELGEILSCKQVTR